MYEAGLLDVSDARAAGGAEILLQHGRRQLGMKLTPAKGGRDYLVDPVERPAEN